MAWVGLGAAGLVTGGVALLMAGAVPTAPPPKPQPMVAVASEADALEIARQQREIEHLRRVREQYRWGIDNLRANIAYVRYQASQLREERKRMPADDPARAELEARLAELPELARGYADNEFRAMRLLAEVEAELGQREAVLKTGVPGL